MTTIAVDSKVGIMAADRRQVSNGTEVIMEMDSKIRQIELSDGVYLIACSGHEGPSEIFLSWYEYGDEYESPSPIDLDTDDEDFEAVILTPKGDILVADRFMTPYKMGKRFYGSGTGGPYAWAILQAGCGMERAMETAVSMDPFSGNGIDYVRLDEVNVIEG